MENTESLTEMDYAKTIGKGRSLRQKEKKLYTDEGIDDDEIEGKRTFNLEVKIREAANPSQIFYTEMKGSDVNLKYFQRNGFVTPILVKEKTGLGLRIPSENFTVDDVKRCVGSMRILDVVDVTTQKDLTMTVKEWVRYYENPDRERLLNVISLEFSHTKLENYVDQPDVIHQMDWVDLAWPWYLKEYQRESTNILDQMMYPKVQKYCLMSVKGCYTDFHIDMGGTSVWYHILKGKKVFWLIPPTEENLQAYECWTLSAKQGDVFFGDTVSTCYHITLEAGWTFFIPTGWIHAVYTPEDSLVFGGNFLHSFGVQMQLRIWEVEIKTHVPTKFRYPLYCELHWYVLERYVSCLMGKHYRTKTAEEICLENGGDFEILADSKVIEQFGQGERINCKGVSRGQIEPAVQDVDLSMVCDNDEAEDNSELENIKQPLTKCSDSRNVFEAIFNITSASKLLPADDPPVKEPSIKVITKKPSAWMDMTLFERDGLTAIVLWLEKLPQNKKCIPKDILDPVGLLSDVKVLLSAHISDSQEKAASGRALLTWPVKKKPKKKRAPKGSRSGGGRSQGGGGTGMWRYRRVRCRACEPCTRSECGDCYFCRDMKKFGGPGRKKQTCVSRQCLAPMLPNNAVCEICNKGDGVASSSTGTAEEQLENQIMECRICFEIQHPSCLKQASPDINHSGVIDEDLPSSWECARCCEEGKEGQGKQRHKLFTVPQGSGQQRRRRQSSGSESSVASSSSAGRSQESDTEDVTTMDSELVDEPFIQHVKQHKKAKAGRDFRSQNSQSVEDSVSESDSGCHSKQRKHIDQQEVYKNKPVVKVKSSTTDEISSRTTSLKKPKLKLSSGKTKKKQSSLKTPSSSLGTGSESEAPFGLVSPLRVNSHGREITTPRRYLL